ncbi:hypothetical protein NDA11_007719 [Ustilago hordei]|nr:hypothetical protein NDA11_007719 [Ustilago hordei]
MSLVVPSSPLVPLFLGMDDNTVIQSPPGSPPPARVVPGPSGEDYSPASPPPHNLNEVGMSCPAWELTTPECQAMWEAELARSPHPSSNCQRNSRCNPGSSSHRHPRVLVECVTAYSSSSLAWSPDSTPPSS